MEKRIFVQDRSGQEITHSQGTGYFSPTTTRPPCNGLAILARKYCAFFGSVCQNCRLCNHRKTRCNYFERAVLQGMDRKEAERYASVLDVALESTRHGRVRVADWDVLPEPAPDTEIHATECEET